MAEAPALQSHAAAKATPPTAQSMLTAIQILKGSFTADVGRASAGRITKAKFSATLRPLAMSLAKSLSQADIVHVSPRVHVLAAPMVVVESGATGKVKLHSY